jgi:hypothetical protein
MRHPTTAKPWYREPWPWILMSGPAAVVAAGAVTTALAVSSFDGLVADDYYKQGLAINRVIARESAARQLGVTASLSFDPTRTHVRVMLGEGARPASLRLTLVHRTLPAEDQSIVLTEVSPGFYEGALLAPRRGALHARLEDGAGRWRLAGEWNTLADSLGLAP